MRNAVLGVTAVAAVILVGIAYVRTPPSEIRFAPASNPPIDFARLEQELPLSRRELNALSPRRMRGFSQEQIDQIYARLTAGPVPDGSYDGDLFFPRGSDGGTRLGELVGGHLGSRLGTLAVREIEFFARTLWKGKVFVRQERLARTPIDLSLLGPLMGGNASGAEPAAAGGARLLFPARVYCGQSLLDGRRESLILDPAFADELPGYRERPDAFAGRNGLRIREEIRMVRPGFYLGRAYMDRIFVLNFTLFSPEATAAGRAAFEAGRVEQDCSIGTQHVAR
jgi:hypothetical protein